MFTRRNLVATATAFATIGRAFPAMARDGYPQNNIRLIVPFPAGGNTDGNARLFLDQPGRLAVSLAMTLPYWVVLPRRETSRSLDLG